MEGADLGVYYCTSGLEDESTGDYSCCCAVLSPILS